MYARPCLASQFCLSTEQQVGRLQAEVAAVRRAVMVETLHGEQLLRDAQQVHVDSFGVLLLC